MENHIRIIVIAALYLASFGCEAFTLEPYPDSRVIQQTQDKKPQFYELLTGVVRRSNTRLLPKEQISVHGTKASITYRLQGRHNLDEVMHHFTMQLPRSASLLFVCKGRDCGPSTYWANTYFKNAILYGPEQYQRYVLARISTNEYIRLYIAQRATGQVYVQVDNLQVVNLQAENAQALSINNPAVQSDAVASKRSANIIKALALTGQYRFNHNENFNDLRLATAIDAAIRQTVKSRPQSTILLVVHDGLKPSETIDKAIERTKNMADAIKKQLGPAADQMSTYGAGPISPDVININRFDLDQYFRVELVLVPR